jgi:hypothetical protein
MRVMWTPADDRRVELRLRQLLSDGRKIEEAIRILHQGDGMGALLICPVVEKVVGLPPIEAKQLVVLALSPIRPE